MAEYGHGNHWRCLTDNVEGLMGKNLVRFIHEGKPVAVAETTAIIFDNELSRHKIFAIDANENETSAITLLATDFKRNVNSVISIYPFFKKVAPLNLRIDSVLEWPNKLEAVLNCTTTDGNPISFFDVFYFKNKEQYIIGKTYSFGISALSYISEALNERSLTLEGEEAINFRIRTNTEIEYDEDNNPKPITFDISDLIVYLPRSADFPDEVDYQSPIQNIELVDFAGEEFYIFEITIYREPDINIHLLAKKTDFEIDPKPNDPIRGYLWMQGYLIED